MAFAIRSLPEISRAVRGAFRQFLPGTDASLKQNALYAIAKAVALLADQYELRFFWLARQMFLSSATDVAWIRRHAGDVGIWLKGAAAASGSIEGTGAPSTVYSAGIRFSGGGNTYLSTAPATSDGGGAVIFVITCEQAGVVTNREAGAVLNLTDPALNPSLSPEFEVGDDGLGGGADVESIESLKARGLYRKRNPVGAGKLTDYEDIARAVPGVLKAWAFRVPASPGAVTVLFLFEGRPDFIPEAGDVAAVQAAIDAKRLIRVDAGEAAAPIEKEIDVTVSGLSLDTSEVRAAIETAIRAMFLERCRPGIAGNTFTVSKSWIAEAISGATGEERHVLTLPAADVTLTNGEFPVLGDLVFA